MLAVSEFFSSFGLSIIVAGLALLILPHFRPNQQPVRALLFLTIAILAWRYLFWRVTETLPPASPLMDYLAAWLFLLLEAGVILSSTTSFFILSRTKERRREVDLHLGWWDDSPPRVDLLITTYNEEEAILERTIVGALASSYKNARVWVLDDGRRPWLALLSHRLGAIYRTRDDNTHAKAGNINAYLDHVGGDPERPDFVVVLDADFVPHVDFVERMLALFHDPHVGVAQSPQHFFNPDPIQHNLGIGRAYPDEQRFFFDHIQPSRDAWSISLCCGTSSMMRFDALARIGGFPTESVTEDFLITLKMRENGYATVYLNEPLTEGLAPEGLDEYITQRGRWCLGFMQIMRSRLGPFSQNGLRLIDRFSLMDSFLFWCSTYPFRIACIIVPLLYWFFGITVVDASVEGVLDHFLPYFIAVMIGLNWVSGGLIIPVLNDVSQLLGASDISKAVVTGLLKPKGHKFKVTAKGGDRSKTVVQWGVMRPLLVFAGLTIAGLLFAPLTDVVFARDPGEGKIIILFWTFYNLAVLGVSLAVCVELPREQITGAAFSPETALVYTPDLSYPVWLTRLSIARARVRGGEGLKEGDPLRIEISYVGFLNATVSVLHEDGFSMVFALQDGERALLLTKLHTGAGGHRTVRTSVFGLAFGLLLRTLKR